MIPRLLTQTAIWLLLQGVLLFWPAGTPAWGAGWVFLALLGGGGLLIGLWLARHDPGLLAERLRLPVHAGQRRRDTVLLAGIGLLWFAWIALMGWDAGRHGFAAVPLPLQGLGALGIAAGLWLVWRVFAVNSFASVTVRLQAERKHGLVDSGPYATVRHPMYGAALLLLLGMPLLLGSWWGLAAVPVFALGLWQRARWEEALLLAELPGYAAYAARVRHRFIPGLW